jgi:hypothetical protein
VDFLPYASYIPESAQSLDKMASVEVAVDSMGPLETAILVVSLVATLIQVAGMWKTFSKAGERGWGAIVPIYNVYLMVKAAEKPWYWMLLFFIPPINVILYLYVQWEVGDRFGFGVPGKLVFTVLAPVSYVATGFGSYTYNSKTEPV